MKAQQVFSIEQHIHEMIHDKALQAISLVFYSILCVVLPIDQVLDIQADINNHAENLLVWFQLISCVVFLITGLWRFSHYLKDRKIKKAKKDV